MLGICKLLSLKVMLDRVPSVAQLFESKWSKVAESRKSVILTEKTDRIAHSAIVPESNRS